MVSVRHYGDLVVWQKSMDLAELCYEITRSFPKDELFGMVSQIRRCACSVPANIAEGHSRGYKKEFLHFLSISKGSLGEFETHLLLAERVGLMNKDQLTKPQALSTEVGKMLNGLMTSVQASLASD